MGPPVMDRSGEVVIQVRRGGGLLPQRSSGVMRRRGIAALASPPAEEGADGERIAGGVTQVALLSRLPPPRHGSVHLRRLSALS